MAEVMEEQQVKRVKRLLEGWRMALIPLKSVLLWEQQWHPCAILLTLSILFFSIWLLDLSTIATFAVFGIILNFIDFTVPIICNTLYSPNSWTGHKEKMFEDVCRDLVVSYNRVVQRMYAFYSLRESSPSMYYLISLSMFLTTAWLASSINNILLLYLLSVTLLLWPGIQHNACFQNILSLVYKTPKPNLKAE